MARRVIADRLPRDVAAAAVEVITGALLEAPYRVGKALCGELAGIRSARVGRDWRVRYEIDESERTVIVRDVRRRCTAYRSR